MIPSLTYVPGRLLGMAGGRGVSARLGGGCCSTSLGDGGRTPVRRLWGLLASRAIHGWATIWGTVSLLGWVSWCEMRRRCRVVRCNAGCVGKRRRLTAARGRSPACPGLSRSGARSAAASRAWSSRWPRGTPAGGPVCVRVSAVSQVNSSIPPLDHKTKNCALLCVRTSKRGASCMSS